MHYSWYHSRGKVEEGKITEEEIQKLIDERTAAKKSKDFARADEIRNELLEKGVVIEDTRAAYVGHTNRRSYGYFK